MAMPTLYPAQANSPQTTIANIIIEDDTTIVVEDASILPEPPNLLVIGTEADAETVLMTAKSGNSMTVQRGIEGKSRVWGIGEFISRNFTAKDHNDINAYIASNAKAIRANTEAIETLLTPAIPTTHTILPAEWQPYEGRYAAVITPPEDGNARYPDPDVRFGIDDLEALNAAGMGPISAEYDDEANILRLIASEIPTNTVSPAVSWRSSYA